MFENEKRHAAICKEINRDYLSAGDYFHKAFHGENGGMELSRALLGGTLHRFKVMSRNQEVAAERNALIRLANYAIMVVIEMDQKPISKASHAAICDEMKNLYHRKNLDYGDSFHLSFLEEGMAMPRIRLGDKYLRFKTLTSGQKQEVLDESVRDTLIDLANYSIMTIMELDCISSSSAGE